MRTDAKIGFAIGAVLLAVLCVYAIVVPKKRTASQTGVAVVIPKVPSNTSLPPSNVSVVTTTDSTSPTPSSTDSNTTPPPSKLDPTPVPPVTAPLTDVTPPKSGDVDWGKILGAPVQSTTPGTLYSASATGSSPVTSNEGNTGSTGTTVTPPPADVSTFTPGFDSPKPNHTTLSNSNESTGSTTHGKTVPSRKAVAHTHPTEVASASTVASKQHVVEAGETLSGIAAEHYGAAHYYAAIMKANPSLNPNRMRPGTKIILPDLSQAIAAAKNNEASIADVQSPRTSIRVDTGGAAGGGVFTPGSSVDTLFATSGTGSSDGNGSYTVHSGDSLYRISKKLYGTGRMADQIFAANKGVIGSDMSRLKLGMVLSLPEAPLN